jgi:hypothetical protein
VAGSDGAIAALALGPAMAAQTVFKKQKRNWPAIGKTGI